MNSDSMDTNPNTETIIFENVINKINQLGKEPDKNDFISNYNEVKSKIIIIDDILEKKSQIGENIPIDKLFEMLEQYSSILDKSSDYSDYSDNTEHVQLDIENFKKMKDIVELIEKKLDNKVNIVEIK